MITVRTLDYPGYGALVGDRRWYRHGDSTVKQLRAGLTQ